MWTKAGSNPAKEGRENLPYVCKKIITKYPISPTNPSSKSPCPCLGGGTLHHSPETSMFIFFIHLQHWVWAFRKTAMDIVVRTNNGIECQNKDSKHKYLKDYKDNSLS